MESLAVSNVVVLIPPLSKAKNFDSKALKIEMEVKFICHHQKLKQILLMDFVEIIEIIKKYL